MKIFKLAELFSLKYKFALNFEELESDLRKSILTLWSYPNKQFNILKACAEAGAKNPKNPDERKAVTGYLFCKELLKNIDSLRDNASTIDLNSLKDTLSYIILLIEKNKDLKFNILGKKMPVKDDDELNEVQFPHVSELIFQMVQVKRKHDFKLRDEQFAKAKAGLSRILSLSMSMLDDINKLASMFPEKFETFENESSSQERFSPQRAPLSNYDIIDFIRQYGDEYGISSQEDWEIVMEADPELKDEMTTVINALNRGHVSRNAVDVKMRVAEILREYEERASNNAHLFEDSE